MLKIEDDLWLARRALALHVISVSKNKPVIRLGL